MSNSPRLAPLGQQIGGGLIPPASGNTPTPNSSPTKGYCHSAHTSPTNTAKLRPRARSAESDNKKLVSCDLIFMFLFHPPLHVELVICLSLFCDLTLSFLLT